MLRALTVDIHLAPRMVARQPTGKANMASIAALTKKLSTIKAKAAALKEQAATVKAALAAAKDAAKAKKAAKK